MLMIIEKRGNFYRLNEFSGIKDIFKEKIENFLIPDITRRVNEYLVELEK